MSLTPDRAGALARIVLGHVEREYPNKLDHVLEGPADLLSPRALHPILCWRELASALPPSDPRVKIASDAAERHLAAGLPHLEGDCMGKHWLASFAQLALTA